MPPAPTPWPPSPRRRSSGSRCGLGMYLVPEAARRVKTGEDARSILVRCLGLIVAGGVPMVLIYVAAGKPLLEAVFGEDLTLASDALPWLGLAMVLLACTYLAVQYLLALRRYRFIWILAAGVVAEVAGPGGGGRRPDPRGDGPAGRAGRVRRRRAVPGAGATGSRRLRFRTIAEPTTSRAPFPPPGSRTACARSTAATSPT